MTVTLSEAESKTLLAEFGVPFAPEAQADTAEHAVIAAEVIGYPVVCKLSGDAIAHKTERGLVKLRLGDAAAVRAASAQLLDAATDADGAVSILVAPMLSGTRELIAGVHTDTQFGKCVMLGVGGVLAEAVADVVFRLAPLEPIDAAEMIASLSSQALLGPFRGEPAVDRDALVGILLALSDVAVTRADVVSVDLNPLLVVDGSPIAVDALVELTP
jgi:succinyl-CoA synthetase beta subunit